jgi:uncharacterized integral membrane protein (TIGR00698 family)
MGAVTHLTAAVRPLLPGVFVAALVAMAAQFTSEHYGAPAMLMALVFGMTLSFLSEPGAPTAPGILFTSRDVLRFGVFLLGARISAELLMDLGLPLFVLVVTAMFATMLFGVLAGRLLGKDLPFSLLTGGAVAICGASAALAIAAVLPQDKKSEQNLLFTVLSVTLLSTLAMVFYPIGTAMLDLSDVEAGAFLGATIHDVAQVVGAGFSISDDAGKTATLVKLTRVTLLAPIVIGLTLLARAKGWSSGSGKRPPLLPLFVLGFVTLAALNSAGLIPLAVREGAITVSRWALLTAIAAVGLKTSLRSVYQLGPGAIGLVVGQSLFLAAFVLAGLMLFLL